MPAEHTVDSPDAGEKLLSHLATFERRSRERGQEYWQEGRVTSITRFNDFTILGEVRGSKLYTVKLFRAGKKWTDACSCPLGGGCKHSVALALDWLSGGRAQSAAATGSSGANAPRTLTFRQQWEPILVDKLGRSLTSEEGAFLGRLANVFQNFRHARGLTSTEILRLGFRTRESQQPPYTWAYQDWWDTPPQTPLELWQYIAYDIETSGLRVPEFMRPITDTSAIRKWMAERERRKTIKRWSERFARLAEQADAPGPAETEVVPQWIDLRLCVGTHWSLESRATPDGSWKPMPRTALERLVGHQPGTLAQFDASPGVFAFLVLCQEQFNRSYRLALNPDEPTGRELLRRVLGHRLARTVVVGPSGNPLTYAPDPVRWKLVATPEDDANYELALHLPDGRPLPPSAVHLPGRPPYYLHDAIIYRGPPALDGSTAAAAIVPAEVVEQPDVLRKLRRLGAELPAEFAGRFVELPLRPKISCAVELDFNENELFTLELSATAASGDHEHTWTHDGWSESLADDATADEGRIVLYDFALADRAAGSLPVLKVAFDFNRECWVRRVTKSLPDEFVAWRESLPPEVEVVATGELASLLTPSVRASIDLALVESTAQRDWFDLALALKPEDNTLTPEEIALLLKARGKLVRLPGKGWRRLSVEIEGASAEALEAAGFDRDAIAEAALAGEKHRFHALQLAQSKVAELLPQRQADALRQRARAIAQPAAPIVPAGLRAELRPYQKEGFEFLAFLSANRLGGILADDMGLGKTVQALAWLLWLAEQQPANAPLRVLVVCPKSVIGNWEAETARFAPALKTVRFTPEVAQASRLPDNDAGGDACATLVLANYTQLRIAADYFSKQQWHVVVLDEGQFIKTPTSKVAQIARELSTEHRLILTGTPIENRLLDLWSLFAFALPGLLGPQAAFKRHYAQDNPLALVRLRARVRHFLLRRTKSQVAADLPPRTEEDVVVELEGEQRKLYDAELKRARAALLKIETAKQLDKLRFNILASLMRLRQICCHAALVDPHHANAPSAKLDELLERVEELRDEGHQVLVFSQFVTMLELIRQKLEAAGVEHLMLTGQTENRDELVRRFQSEKNLTVFLLSLKAAGFGLNLTAASYVILFDPWWNPAVEAQAIDRTHRIGQSVPVIAYRLIARGTVEEKIRALQKEKAALAGAIVQEESLASVLDLDSLREILG